MNRVLRNILIACFIFFVLACLLLGYAGYLNINVVLGGLTSVVLLLILIVILRSRIGH